MQKTTYQSKTGGYTETYTLSALGPTLITSVGQPTGNTSTSRPIYENGRLSSWIEQDGSKTQYFYSGDLLQKWIDGTGNTISFEYWNNGLVKKETRVFAPRNSSSGLSQFVTLYNEKGLDELSLSYDLQGHVVGRWPYHYEYDKFGNGVKKLSPNAGGTNTTRQIDYY